MPLFIPRLLLFAVAVVLLVLLLFYAFTRDRRYLRWAGRLFVYALVALIGLGVVMMIGRIVRFS